MISIFCDWFFAILVFKTFEFSIFAKRLESLLVEASDLSSSLFFKFSTEDIFDEWGIIALSFVMFRCRDLFIASHTKISNKVAPIARNIETAFRCPFMQWIQFLQQGASINTQFFIRFSNGRILVAFII